MPKSFRLLIAVLIVFSACVGEQENKEAKEMMQGVWYNSDTNERSLYVKGDTIYFADPVNVPSYFRIVDDSLEIFGANVDHYAIYRQAPHIFCFYNLNGELVKLRKGNRMADTVRFAYKGRQQTIRKTLQKDSTIIYKGEKFHFAITISPSNGEVLKQTYTNDGIQVDNLYFDNSVNLDVKRNDGKLFKGEVKKLDYAKAVPSSFLSQAVFADLDFDRADAKGLHFNAVFSIPNEKLSYIVETIITPKGKLELKQEE